MHDFLDTKPILLTGGRGCLAGVLSRYLESRGAFVTRLSRTEGDGCRSLEDFFAGRVTAPGGMLLHLAWSTVPFTAEQTPGMEQREDLPLLERILAKLAALPAKDRPHLVFFSSGGTIYGNARDGRPNREDDPCLPIGRHGKAKLAAFHLLERAATHIGLPWTSLRISNIYGFPLPTTRAQGIIPLAIKAALEGRTLTIWGDGTARKDFLYYTDFVQAVGQVILRRPEGLYNLCSGESHSLFEIISLVEQTTGRPITVRHVPAHAWDVHDSRLDGRKLYAAVDWHPLVSLAEGIKLTVAELSRP